MVNIFQKVLFNPLGELHLLVIALQGPWLASVAAPLSKLEIKHTTSFLDPFPRIVDVSTDRIRTVYI